MNPTLGDWRAIAVAPSSGPGAAVKDRHWDLLIVCLTGYVLTVVGRVHQLFSVLEPFRLALLTAGLGIVLYLLDGSRARRLGPILRLRTTRCVLGLALWMAFSIPGALWPGGAFQEFTDEFAKAAIMYVVLAAAPRGFLDVERLTFAYLVAVGTYATVVLSRFSVGADQWRLASLYYYDANDFAALTVMALPLAVYFVVRRGQLWRRLAGATAAVLLAVGFIWAGSRGGFLALLAVGAFLLLRYRAIRVRWRVSIAAVITLVFAATATDTYWEKMSTIVQPKDDYNVTGNEGRVQVWTRGLGYMMQHPVLGVGAGNFPTAEGTISPLVRTAPTGRGIRWGAAHNSLVQVGAELGVPGLMLFVVMLGSAFRALRDVARSNPPRTTREHSAPPAQLAQALTASLVGYAVGGFFLSLAYRDLLYVLLGLVVGLAKVSRQPPVQPIPRVRTFG
ncbi:MAG TPA: O-antigen ligase family protein [Gemmatimonadales bacterium]|nr:O-antigen ligase family protein [Gemmatimonadales bacterium]